MVVCVDFDGVLNNYDGYAGDDELFEPKEGVHEFLQALNEYCPIIVFTARDQAKVEKWLEEHGLDHLIREVTNVKKPAVAYIDDRGLKFNGNFDETLKELELFKVHWSEECPFKSWKGEEEEHGSLEERGIIPAPCRGYMEFK